MPRLSRPTSQHPAKARATPSRPTRRGRDDRGAVKVVTALLLVPLIGFAAISVDVAEAHSQRQQLQHGADAAALAVAQDCARGSCQDADQTAAQLAQQNASDPVQATVTQRSGGTVTVRTDGSAQFHFAPVLGHDRADLQATATARYGAPSAGTGVLPLTFSWCDFAAQTGGGMPSGSEERVIKFTKSSSTQCHGPSRNAVPGGFGWLKPDHGCQVRTRIKQQVSSDPGNSVPSGCSANEVAKLRNQTVLLPIFDVAGGQGNNAWYQVYGYAAFVATGYHFGGQYSWNASGECSGSTRCIKGYFTRFVALDRDFELSSSAPSLGGSVVTLTG